VVLRAPLSAEERAQYRAERVVFARVFRAFQHASPNGSWNEFVFVATRTEEGRRALAAWRRSKQIEAFPEAKRALLAELLDRHRHGRVLVFTPDNASAYRVAREHLIMPLTCDIKRRERDAVLERFRRGELGALVSSRVLNEGLDVPDADVAIVVGGSLGSREHIQRVGRLLRPSPGKRAIIYELVASGTSETWSSLRRRRALDARTVPAA
jgi:superfamily II DNA or RNA helicase